MDSGPNYSERGAQELIILNSIQGLLLLVRLLSIIYFANQLIKHLRLQGDKRDNLTTLTLLFLLIQTTVFFSHRLFSEIIELAHYLSERRDLIVQLDQWIRDNRTLLTILGAITRPGLGYTMQNLALAINIYRWKAILENMSSS